MTPPIRVVDVDVASAFDPEDPPARTGWADAIFVATVDQYLSTEAPSGSAPQTQFDVSVVEELKGLLAQTVVVSQPGGSSSTGDLIVVNDTSLVESGRTYLFSARIDPETGWFTLAPEKGAVALPDEIPVSSNELVQQDRNAIANRKPLGGDEASQSAIPN